MRDELLECIQKDCFIYRGEKENQKQYCARIIYSAIGRQALTSLWDIQNGNQPKENDADGNKVSVTYFRRSIEKTINGFKTIYPEIFTDTFLSDNRLTDENIIDKLFCETGQILHKNNWYASAQRKAFVISDRTVCFVRNPYPIEQNIYVSGIGAYINLRQYNKSIDQVLPMHEGLESFGIENINLDTIFENTLELLSSAEWEVIAPSDDIEYFNISGFKKYGEGYWKREMDKNTSYTVGRMPDSDHYYLIDVKEKMQKKLPRWLSKDGRYRYLMASILKKENLLPTIKIKNDGNIVILHLDFLLGRGMQYFIELYSWPIGSKIMPYTRVMSKIVFDAIRPIVENMGYVFEEW